MVDMALRCIGVHSRHGLSFAGMLAVMQDSFTGIRQAEGLPVRTLDLPDDFGGHGH
ncbi:hypothetical protein THIX_20486 [Thiomonas sp. X19]|nr:hypothetical protein THIX_20486 [Thiomonas sp. X19]